MTWIALLALLGMPAGQDACADLWAKRSAVTHRPQTVHGFKVVNVRRVDTSGTPAEPFYEYRFTLAASFAQSKALVRKQQGLCQMGSTCYLPLGTESRFTVERAGKASSWSCMDHISEQYGYTN